MNMDREIARNYWHELFTAYPCVEKRILEKDIDELSLHNRALHIDYDVLVGVDFDFAGEILNFPEDMIPLGCSILKDDANLSFAPKIRITNLPNTDEVSIRDLRAAHMYKLIQVEGTVRRTSEVKPEIIEARFECVRCGDIISIIQVNSQNFQTPAVCPNEECGRTGPFRLIEQSSRFEDWQNVRIQESPESLRGGEMPRFIDVILREEIVEAGQTGNKAIIVGVLKAIQDTGLRGKKTTYTKYLEANSIIIREKTYEDMELTPEEEERMEEMASDPDIHLKIQRSIAPTIYGHENVKAAIALQQFSNRQRLLPDGTKQRGDIHVLLVGDPGVAKSQMLAYAAFISPRGVYTSGKGASSAGLTAAVLKDEIAGGYTLEAGALVIADNGLACIAKGQKVLTVNGLTPIEDIAPGTKVKCYKKGVREQVVISNLCRGQKNTLNLRTASGHSLCATYDHRIYDGKAWKMAEEYKAGDPLIIISDEAKQINTYIESVESGPTTTVYDLSITNIHNFIASGFIVHNCVDEIEKMSEDDRSGIHQAMEQQACSISKAGIMATLNTRCAILAAANPKRGRFDSHNPLPNQTELEPTILSRFDLIFFMADRPKRETDTLISDHILKTHAGELAHITPEVSIEDIKRYVIYQKKRIPHVMLSTEAKTRLQDYYVDLRVKGETGAIPITARQLQSLVRLASARARMRGNTTASIDDANAVLDIYEAALGDSAMDYESGELDIDMIMTGKPKSQRDNMSLVLDIIESLDKKSEGKGALRSEVATDAQAEGISGDKLWRMIKDLKESGDVYEPTPDRLKLTLERVHIGG
jgi:replicative DNA helicase Mcm